MPMSLLGIDYGEMKIGLAIAEGVVATPLRVVRPGSRRELAAAIRGICDDYGITTIVVGVPRDPATVAEFLDWLRREFSIAVVTEDEQLTTQFAKRLMRGWKGKAEDDAIAAALILQTYIERQRLSSS